MHEQLPSQLAGRLRRVPVLRNVRGRTILGLVLAALSVVLSAAVLGADRVVVLVFAVVLAWLPAVWLTDKYVHKYPQRYFTYFLATHLKAALIMAVFLGLVGWAAGIQGPALTALWTSYGVFVVTDALASLPNRRQGAGEWRSSANALAGNAPPNAATDSPPALSPIDTRSLLATLAGDADPRLLEFLSANLPTSRDGSGGVQVVATEDAAIQDQGASPAALLLSRLRVNDVRHLDPFIAACANRLLFGGYFVGQYVPHHTVAQELSKPGFLLHFVWHRAFPKLPGLDRVYFAVTKGRNRVLSKVEVWGRLSYAGLNVIAESAAPDGVSVLAQRVALPLKNKTPSYYPIVGLEKVGLDGSIVRLHKVRSMYPYSEFLQKRIFEDHGLATTGKFANDYRLTEYGPFLRRYWLDELPQLLDWVRGDVKLVGMRATSRHYLTLYPQTVYDLYIQTKPGLIPPIFDEATTGLEGIIEVELTYLRRYWESPLRTDVRYFMQTFTDIFLRGVRSK